MLVNTGVTSLSYEPASMCIYESPLDKISQSHITSVYQILWYLAYVGFLHRLCGIITSQLDPFILLKDTCVANTLFLSSIKNDVALIAFPTLTVPVVDIAQGVEVSRYTGSQAVKPVYQPTTPSV